MMDAEPIVTVHCETRRIPDSSGRHLAAVALIRGDGREPYVTPVKIPGRSIEDIEGIKNLPYPADAIYQAPPPSVVRNVVKSLAFGATVLIWNQEHVTQCMPFLNERDQRGRRIFQVQDVMRRAAPYRRSWNPFYTDYEYPTLELAAETFGLTFEDPASHSARACAQMVLNIWAHMEANPPFHLANKELLTEVTPPRPSALLDDLSY